MFTDGGLLACITIGVNTTNYGIMQPPSGSAIGTWMDRLKRRNLVGILTVGVSYTESIQEQSKRVVIIE
jgi:hypothetical protein